MQLFLYYTTLELSLVFLFLNPYFGIAGIVFGVLLGAFFHLLINVIAVKKIGNTCTIAII